MQVWITLMAEFFLDYGLFLAKTVTLVLAIGAVIAMIAAASRRGGGKDETLRVEHLNAKFRRIGDDLRSATMSAGDAKALRKQRKAERKSEKSQTSDRPKTFVLDFKGDIRAQAVAALREEISAILSVAGESDAVVVKMENPGGAVPDHGLGAAQLARLRDAELDLTVVVDKVAASGGYLMACVAHRIVAAPFAIIGSIGVIAQLPNFRRLLKDKGIDVEQVTAGKYKRTVTMFGENTDEDRAKLKQELEAIHRQFKDVVQRYRPELDLEKVATGEYWHGTEALELGLIDGIETSDGLLHAACEDRDLYAVHYEIKQPLQKKLLGAADSWLSRAVESLKRSWVARAGR
ncbi:MAG: protease SohB [Pseudomonadota bacterium]